MLFKKQLQISVLAGALAACLPAFASSYYLVVPVPNRTGKPPATPGTTPGTTPSTPAPTPDITVSLSAYALPAAYTDEAYAAFDFHSLLQVRGDAAYSGTGVTFAIADGALPAGLSLDAATGLMSGTPTAAGTSTFSVRATYRTTSGQQAYQVVTTTISVTLAGTTLPAALAGTPYVGFDFKPLAASSDTAFDAEAVRWSAVGQLPAGMALDSHGGLSGTPTTSGVSPFTVEATYRGHSARREYSMSSRDAALVLSGTGWGKGTQTLPDSQSWTVEAWLSLGAGSSAGGVVLSDSDPTNGNDMLVGINATTVYARADKTSSSGTLTSSGPQGSISWAHGKTLGSSMHHVVWSAGAGRFVVYIDSVPVATSTATFSNRGYHSLILGAWSDSAGASRTFPYTGTLSEVRYFSREVSSSEVASMYSAGRNRPLDSGVAAAWKFNEGSGAMAKDAAGGNTVNLNGTYSWQNE